MKKTYKIHVDCANCANLMEVEAKKILGVREIVINFMTQKMKIDFEENVDQNEIMQRIHENCKRIEKDCEIFL